MKRFLKFLFLLVLIPIFIVLVFLAYTSYKDYKPKAVEIVFQGENNSVINDSAEVSLLIWNLGYCGLNKEMDFFYSGGEQVYPTKEVVNKNILGVMFALKKLEQIDFMLFQEVDKHSQRSHFTDQISHLGELFPKYHSDYGLNYLVPFVPVPISKPMGAVNSGLLTLGKYTPSKSIRYSYDGNFSWPKSLFLLDRCFLVNRYKVDSGKELIIINTHNSAYDDGGLRQAQMQQIKSFVLAEYQQGNYVIVGGDFNQCAPGFVADFNGDKMDLIDKLDISPELFPADWTWFYDNKEPTNRRNKTAYVKGETLTTVIDFYLLSPNVKSLSIRNIDMGFSYSDHQAVVANVKLIPQSR